MSQTALDFSNDMIGSAMQAVFTPAVTDTLAPVKFKKPTVKFERRERLDTAIIECSNCHRDTVVSDDTVKAVICFRCSVHCGPRPDENSLLAKAPSGYPKGWQFMREFVDKDGNVFLRGVEQPKLKGTQPVTVVERGEKLSTAEKNRKKDEKLAKLAARHEKKIANQKEQELTNKKILLKLKEVT